LEASQQISFLQCRIVSPKPNPHPGEPGFCIISPRGRVATHFSRLLRHAWVTVGLFLFPGHHTGSISHSECSNLDVLLSFPFNFSLKFAIRKDWNWIEHISSWFMLTMLILI
jgi:hypothetical protein